MSEMGGVVFKIKTNKNQIKIIKFKNKIKIIKLKKQNKHNFLMNIYDGVKRKYKHITFNR